MFILKKPRLTDVLLFIQINLQKDIIGKSGKAAKKGKKEKPKGKVSYYFMQYCHA